MGRADDKEIPTSARGPVPAGGLEPLRRAMAESQAQGALSPACIAGFPLTEELLRTGRRVEAFAVSERVGGLAARGGPRSVERAGGGSPAAAGRPRRPCREAVVDGFAPARTSGRRGR
ncbi:hypothetical protein GCM10027168_11560 [Streptomyces capparidis]